MFPMRNRIPERLAKELHARRHVQEVPFHAHRDIACLSDMQEGRLYLTKWIGHLVVYKHMQEQPDSVKVIEEYFIENKEV